MDLSGARLFVSTIHNRGIETIDLNTIDASAGVQHFDLAPETSIADLAA